MLLKILVFFIQGLIVATCLTLENEMDGLVTLTSNDDGTIDVSFLVGGVEKLSGQIGHGFNLVLPSACQEEFVCTIEADNATLKVQAINSGFLISWSTSNPDIVFQDCYDLKIGDWSWFGGPEKWQQDWPIENTVHLERPYIPMKTDNGAVAERYWLNSAGGWIFVHDEAPLFLDQNNLVKGSICFVGKTQSPYVARERTLFEYELQGKDNIYRAHFHAVNVQLGSPRARPSNEMIRYPIWTTWAKYRKEINDNVITSFAKDIANHGFTGQIVIDEMWETCFGTLRFDSEKFGEIKESIQTIKDLGFKVTLWTHPFVNTNCKEPVDLGREQEYFIKSSDGKLDTTWWEGTAHHIDFTNEKARTWWSKKLKVLQEEYGIDNFKCDSGESDYPPPNPVFADATPELTPGWSTYSYIDTCASFGNATEVRSAWRNQHKPFFLRMIDKDSRWTINNGLHSLITTLLNLSLQGYSYILPDIIGGNGYGDELPSPELLVRWIQANTFMPVMQFGYLPWDFPSDDFDIVAITKKFVDLHLEYAEVFEAAINRTISHSEPINLPIWYIDPTNKDAIKVNDEYLLGQYVLVAPVIEEGATSRNIVLPAGTWEDGNDGTIYEGPLTLTDYPAPIDVLPYFILQEE